MSFKTAQQKTTVERELYYGIAKVKVLVVNPTHEQLKKIYNNPEVKAPEYKFINRDGEQGIRLDFFFKSTEPAITDKVTFFLGNSFKVSQKGSMQVINSQGQSSWVQDINNINLEWFNKQNVRQAREGEVDLYNFLCTLFNIDTRDPKTNVVLETYDNILKGNVTELNELIQYFDKQKNISEIKVLLGVKDGKYQAVYNGAFMSANSKNVDYLHKAATGEYGGFAAQFKVVGEPVVYKSDDFISDSKPMEPMAFNLGSNPFGVQDDLEPTTETLNPFGMDSDSDDLNLFN